LGRGGAAFKTILERISDRKKLRIGVLNDRMARPSIIGEKGVRKERRNGRGNAVGQVRKSKKEGRESTKA